MNKTTTLTFLLPALLSAAAAARQGSFLLVDGVVVDAAGETVHLMRPAGGIEAVAVASGTTRWSSDDADKPLGLHDATLVAQIESPGTPGLLRIAALDADTGAVREQTRASLPPGVSAGIDEGLGRSFSSRVITGASGPLVTWEYVERYSKGIAPPSGEPLAQTRVGAYRLEAQGGRMVPARDAELAQARAAAAVALPAALTEWAAARPSTEAPTATGGVHAATEVTGGMSSESGRITLKRWDRSSGAALPDVELHRGPHVLQLRSVDGRHVLIAERVAPGDLEEYEWSIFSLETGARAGQLRHRRSHAQFFVNGPLVVLVEPPYARREGDEVVGHSRRVRAAVLGSGSIVWERDLRDTAYRGPFPP